MCAFYDFPAEVTIHHSKKKKKKMLPIYLALKKKGRARTDTPDVSK